MMYRTSGGAIEMLIAHPGGPLFARRDHGAWTVPKGLVEPGESPFETAKREFTEETGFAADAPTYLDLGSVRLESGKVVLVWAFEGDCDPDALHSNLFELEWPRRSGKIGRYPEVDRVAWATADIARRKLNPAQAAFVDRLLAAHQAS